MKQAEYTTRVLIAEDGHYLTQADNTVSADERVLTSKVYLAANDTPANWREVTAKEADGYRQLNN